MVKNNPPRPNTMMMKGSFTFPAAPNNTSKPKKIFPQKSDYGSKKSINKF
jgi:hypothetical protein